MAFNNAFGAWADYSTGEIHFEEYQDFGAESPATWEDCRDICILEDLYAKS